MASHDSAMSITVKGTLNYYILILVVGVSVSVASVVETSIATQYKLVCLYLAAQQASFLFCESIVGVGGVLYLHYSYLYLQNIPCLDFARRYVSGVCLDGFLLPAFVWLLESVCHDGVYRLCEVS